MLLVIAFQATWSVARRSRRQHLIHLAPQQLGEFEPINLRDTSDGDRTRRRVWLYDFVTTSQSTTVPYNLMWDHQKSLVGHQLSRIGKGPKDPPLYDQFIPLDLDSEDIIPQSLLGCDSVIFVEHDPVYTLGTASDASFIRGYKASSGGTEEVEKSGIPNYSREKDSVTIPIVRIERGGEVTYHGPGQLVVYPIIDLRGYKQDIHWYMRALEEVIILALEKAGVKGATRENNLTGVWVSNKKIAALGIKARRWVTMHGLAINVDMKSLQNFEGIVPCGLEGREVTCINEEFTSGNAESCFTIKEFAVHVREALEEIFGVTLVSAPTLL
ncbi:hypothetical protein HJC23_014099 [Cyclotella cryptica]|uniref:lipoyl(octanoyl) transferase n=1 Tax=Cyclotella cryptica TaxID=29204 RepID=A0ABD3QUE8_9STRA